MTTIFTEDGPRLSFRVKNSYYRHFQLLFQSKFILLFFRSNSVCSFRSADISSNVDNLINFNVEFDINEVHRFVKFSAVPF